MAENKIGPGPENTCQAGNDKNAFVVAKPNRKNDWRRVEQNERNLMTSGQVQPSDCEEQRQRLNKGKRRGLPN